MTTLQTNTDELLSRIEDALDVSETIETPEGDVSLPESSIRSIQETRLADTIAEYISEVAMKSPEIESTTFAPGSGDTGRQAKLVLDPHNDVDKSELISLGEGIDELLSKTGIFPVEYMISVAHKMGIDEEGYPSDRDEFHLCFSYCTRSRKSPQAPPTEHTRIA